MPLRDLATKAMRAVRAGSAMSHTGAGDGKPMRNKFDVRISQTVRAENKESVDKFIEMLEAKLQEMGGLQPLIELCELESPIITDGLPDVSVGEQS